MADSDGTHGLLSAVHEPSSESNHKAVQPRGKHERWWDLLLNHDSNCEMIEVIPNCDEIELNKVVTAAHNYLKRNEQKKPLESIHRLPRATGLIVGPAGTGKTLTGIMIGVCYFRMGGQVMLSSPTEASADTLLLPLLEILKDLELPPMKCNIVRVHCNRFEHDEIFKGESHVQDIEHDKSAKSDKDTDDNKNTAKEAIELTVALQHLKEIGLQSSRFPEYSLTRQVVDRAQREDNDPYMMKYTPVNQSGKQEIIDVWPALREYIERLNNPKTCYHTWSKDNKARYAACFLRGQAKVMEDAHIVIATGNNLGCDAIAENFGKNAKFIVKIEDDANRMLEPDTLVGITLLRAYEKVRGLWLIGDSAQPGPVVRSLHSNVNPFAFQLELSLFARLYLSRFPCFELVLSGRMHRFLLYFPNQRTYKGLYTDFMKCPPKINNLQLPESYKLWYKDYFKVGSDENCRLFAMFADGECVQKTSSDSKYNLESAAHTCHMVNDIREKNRFLMEDIVILTPYARQKWLLNTILTSMAQNLEFSRDAFPMVETIDSFASKEAKMIILDTVVTSELGILDNEKRMNFCCTRAKWVFIIVGSKQTRALAEKPKGKGKGIQGDNVGNPTRRFTMRYGKRYYHENPYLADYLQWLTKKKLVFEARPDVSWNAIQAQYSVPFRG